MEARSRRTNKTVPPSARKMKSPGLLGRQTTTSRAPRKRGPRARSCPSSKTPFAGLPVDRDRPQDLLSVSRTGPSEKREEKLGPFLRECDTGSGSTGQGRGEARRGTLGLTTGGERDVSRLDVVALPPFVAVLATRRPFACLGVCLGGAVGEGGGRGSVICL